MSSENPVCPLAQAHRRLEDAHRLWHQTADLYSDPDGFRVNLNATIQTLRNVTFALQKQKAVIPSFEAWYQPWQRRMREDPLLRWLVDARNRIVKEEDLVTQSVARIRIVDRYTEVAFVDREVPPLTTLEAVLQNLEDHPLSPDAVQNGTLQIERRWVSSDLPDQELLDVLAHCYGVLALLIDDAHRGADGSRQVGHRKLDGTVEYLPADHLSGRLPCMVATAHDRTTWVRLVDGTTLEPASVERTITRDELKPQLDTIDPKLRRLAACSPDDPIKKARDYWLEVAKATLLRDGYHNTILLSMSAAHRLEVRQMHARDCGDKYVLWRHVAAEVERSGADWIVVIGETWLHSLDLETGERAATIEGLAVAAATSEGRQSQWFTPFTRGPAGIEIGETVEAPDVSLSFLEPVMDVWRRRLSPASSSGRGTA